MTARPEIVAVPEPGVPIGLPSTTVSVCPITVIVPLILAFPELAAVKVKEPGPVPLDPAVTVSQLALDTADHTQPVWVFTETVPVPPG
jgi:hypothetical protein